MNIEFDSRAIAPAATNCFALTEKLVSINSEGQKQFDLN